MNASRDKHSFLLSVTLTELGFILFFLLLLVAFWKLRDLSREKDTAKMHAEANHQRVDQLIAEKDQLSERVKDLETENAQYGAYKKILDEHNGMIPDQFKELVRISSEVIAEKRELEQSLRESKLQNENLREENQQLESSKQDLTGQVLNYQRRFGQGGRDFPPCWADESGNIEYIYRVVVGEKVLSVEPAWPEWRADDISTIPGAREAVGGSLSIKEFRNRVASVLGWSKQRAPECRHFVILVDHAKTKDSFKVKRFAVEDYFYKYESRS